MSGTLQSFRGVHYDLARGNYDSLASLRELITVCAGCGLNELVLYMEDLWRYTKHPQLANPHAYALDDMGELATFAATLGVDMIPSLTTIGHSAHILQKAEYAHLAFPGPRADFDVFNPAVYELFADLFDEVLPHFSSPYVHINGDEVQYLALSEAARAFVRQHGMGGLYGTGLGRLARMILERGRRPIVWHDMLLHHPEALGYLPKDTIICYWFYDSQPEFHAIDFFRTQGFDVLAAPGVINNRSKYPDIARALANVHGQCRAAAQSLTTAPEPAGDRLGTCLGTLTTIWEHARWRESLLPIYATGRWTRDAEVSRAQVLADFARDVYGVDAPTLGRAWMETSRLAGATGILAEARACAHTAEEHTLIETEIAANRSAQQPLIDWMTTVHPCKNVEIYHAMVSAAEQMHACGQPTKGFAPHTATAAPFLCSDQIDSKAQTCRLVETQTPYGHRLAVLTNGLITLSILPDFAASMVELVLCGDEPQAFIRSDSYQRWAAETPLKLGDPGLLSPWGARAATGWRETIYYNARLNPSSLWGCPFSVQVITSTPSEIIVEFAGASNVADVRQRVQLRAGQRAFSITATVTNRIMPGYLAIQPNVGYEMPGACAAALQLIHGDTTRLLADHDGTMAFTPQGDVVRIQSRVNDHFLQLRFQPEEVHEILTDVGGAWFTLEPFTRPRFCRTGESITQHLEYELG